MYQPVLYSTNLSGVGLSLKPPAWLRNIAGAVIRGTTVTVPTPAGNVNVDLGNPASVAAAKAALTGTKVSVTAGQRPPSAAEQVNAAVENIPGGWLTVAAVAIGAVVLLPMIMRRGR